MKLLAGLAASAAADSYVTCNSFASNAVEMKMMIDIADVQDAAGPGADWTKNDADTQWEKTFTPTADDTTEETEGTAKFLQVTKVVDSEGCDKTTVDGVEVCVAKGHQFTFTCKYPLADQTVSTADDFTVSGSDTTDSATGTGTLNYALAVDVGAAFAIGNTVTATITPVSSGLVTASILSCEVSNSDLTSANEVSILKTCSTQCPDGWSEFTLNGKSSCLKNTGKSAISSAAATCASMGSHLPLPLNKQHDTEMRNAFDTLGAQWTALDGTDVDKEGEWHQADGTVIEYFNMYSGQPDNHNHGTVTENYLATWLSNKWNDYPAHYLVNVVCQQNMPECCPGCSPDVEHHLEPTCELGVAITTGQGDSTLGFTWNSFKWSTTKVGNDDAVENQELTCSISLAKTQSTVTSKTCA